MLPQIGDMAAAPQHCGRRPRRRRRKMLPTSSPAMPPAKGQSRRSRHEQGQDLNRGDAASPPLGVKLLTLLAGAGKIAHQCAADNRDRQTFFVQLVKLELIKSGQRAAKRRLRRQGSLPTTVRDDFYSRHGRARTDRRFLICKGAVSRPPGENPMRWARPERDWLSFRNDRPLQGAEDALLPRSENREPHA